MTNLRQAAEMALNLIEVYSPEYMHGEPKQNHVKRLRQALAAPKREWVGLTDEEIDDLLGNMSLGSVDEDVRLIEAKLKEKNK